MAKRSTNRDEWLLTGPSLLWMTFFFLLPTLVVFAMAFKPKDAFGGLGPGWTLEGLRGLMDPNYPELVWRTLWLSLLTTLVCVTLATPMAFFMARVRQSLRNQLLLLVIVPFWTNFLIRIFAWKTLLHPEGLLKGLLVSLGLASPDAILLYRSESVLIVLIYTSLPFAILPIYAAAEKFDFSLLEAARDLGAKPARAFMSVFVPGISKGIATAVLMVFIPALGSYVIPDLVGGPSGEMIGNKIAQRTFVDRNLPHAAGLAALLTLAVLIPPLLGFYVQRWLRKRNRAGEAA